MKNDLPTSTVHERSFLILLMSSMTYQRLLIKFSSKSFSDALPPNTHAIIILSQITEDEISKICFLLQEQYSNGPNSIPTTILKLLPVQISKQFTILTYTLLLVFSFFKICQSYSNSDKNSKLVYTI